MSPRLSAVVILFTGLACAGVFAQDVASVKPSPPAPLNRLGFPTRALIEIGAGGRISATQATLIDLIRRAYNLQPFEVEGGPEWASSDRFDVTARGDLRALLADRFKLRVRTETRDTAVYLLVPARSDRRLGPQIRPSTVDCAAAGADCAPAFDANMSGGTMIMKFKGETMGGLARLLVGPNTRRPVLDRTGIAGTFDGELSFAPEPLPGLPPFPQNADAVSLFTALQEQFGLKLEAGRGPGEVLVIEGAEKPAGN
jgi:uncharacterized protein (TIGR03435 family)